MQKNQKENYLLIILTKFKKHLIINLFLKDLIDLNV
jgi:hypothetical protein